MKEITLSFSNEEDLKTAQDILNKAFEGVRTVTVADAHSIGLRIKVSDVNGDQLGKVDALVAGVNAQIDEHCATFKVATRELAI